ncbi:MAG TPA: ABC transporter substrate-binding protein, partial [Cupriavidus sp.]|nr:ABC transporter substrate-binding protein [Cupriavidus sp.]
MPRFSRCLPLIAALLGTVVPAIAHAAYPDHALRLIVPFSAGGSRSEERRGGG